MIHAQRSPRLARRAPSLFAALAALGLLAAPSLIGACEKAAPPAFERPPAPVTVAAAAKQDVPLYLDEIGKCVAREPCEAGRPALPRRDRQGPRARGRL